MKIAVLGAAGRMGSMHARHLIEMGHEINGYDHQPLPADIQSFSWESDAVVIATPADCHLRDLAIAVSNNKHVFVEKPLCLVGQSTKVRNILQHADEKGLIVATGYNLRFHPLVMQAKDAIATGKLKPLLGSFLLRQKPARPIAHFLEEWASHEVDLALHLMGRDAADFRVTKDQTQLQLVLKHVNSAVSFIHADAYTEPFRRSFTLVDQNGTAFTRDIELQHVQPAHYRAELAAWIDNIEYGERSVTPLATGRDGLAVIELLERLTK